MNGEFLNINNEFKVIAAGLMKSLENVEKFGAREYYSFEIDCSQLKNWNEISIRESEEYALELKKLSDFMGPALYWFEIVSQNSNDVCLNAISEYKKSNSARSTPSIRKSLFKESKALYLGKTKSKLSESMINHLGYNSEANEKGLQLFHWAKPLNLKLKLHSYLFDVDMEDLVSILELKISRKLRPITSHYF